MDLSPLAIFFQFVVLNCCHTQYKELRQRSSGGLGALLRAVYERHKCELVMLKDTLDTGSLLLVNPSLSSPVFQNDNKRKNIVNMSMTYDVRNLFSLRPFAIEFVNCMVNWQELT